MINLLISLISLIMIFIHSDRKFMLSIEVDDWFQTLNSFEIEGCIAVPLMC